MDIMSTIRMALTNLLGGDQTISTTKDPNTGQWSTPAAPTPTSPYPRFTSANVYPTSTPTPVPQPAQQPNITIPDRGNTQVRLPIDIAQNILNSFNDVNQATNAASLLRNQNPGGENRSFNPNAVNVNTDGSKDTGLFQINQNTFNDFMRRKGSLMRAKGINSYQDMYDPQKNADMARIIYDEQGFKAWYGGPVGLK